MCTVLLLVYIHDALKILMNKEKNKLKTCTVCTKTVHKRCKESGIQASHNEKKITRNNDFRKCKKDVVTIAQIHTHIPVHHDTFTSWMIKQKKIHCLIWCSATKVIATTTASVAATENEV